MGDMDRMPMDRVPNQNVSKNYEQRQNKQNNEYFGQRQDNLPPNPPPPGPFPPPQSFNPMMMNPNMMNPNLMMNNPMMMQNMQFEQQQYMMNAGRGMNFPQPPMGPFPPDFMLSHPDMMAPGPRGFPGRFQGRFEGEFMGYDQEMMHGRNKWPRRFAAPPSNRPKFNNNIQSFTNQNGNNNQYNNQMGQGNMSNQNMQQIQAPTRGQANDYSQNFVDTGQRPQNFLQDATMKDIYEDYPLFKRLIILKNEMVKSTNNPPYCLKADLKDLKLNIDTFGTKFDVILIDPPWEEYVKRAPGLTDGVSWSWRDIEKLDISSIADNPSFIFLWAGANEFLDAARHCLTTWGFRRCEDICWIKSNRQERKIQNVAPEDQDTVFQHTKEHCLMGIRGTVRRNIDGHLIHANCDTDVLVAEEPLTPGSTRKPEDIYEIIERFSLGKRRLELFGEDHNIRPGWVTVGNNLSYSNFNPQTYSQHFKSKDGQVFTSYKENQKVSVEDPNLVGSTEEIESLRPKSPPPIQSMQQQSLQKFTALKG